LVKSIVYLKMYKHDFEARLSLLSSANNQIHSRFTNDFRQESLNLNLQDKKLDELLDIQQILLMKPKIDKLYLKIVQ